MKRSSGFVRWDVDWERFLLLAPVTILLLLAFALPLLAIVPEATHLFEEPGALEIVADMASSWFTRHLLESPS